MKHPWKFTFEPAGFCIYCHARDCDLTDEHIVPYAFGGNLVLPKASCNTCQQQTKLFTERVARSIYHPIRIRMNVQSRTKPKNRPASFPVWVKTETGFDKKTLVPAHLFPRTYHVPVLALPSDLTGITVKNFFSAARREIRSDIDELYRLGVVGPNDFFMIKERFFTAEFFRLLAQIGHAYMFAILRGVGAVPFLEPVILGYGIHLEYDGSGDERRVSGDFHGPIGGVEKADEIDEMLRIDIVRGFKAFFVRVRFRMPVEQGWQFPTYQILAGWLPHQGAVAAAEKRLSNWI